VTDHGVLVQFAQYIYAHQRKSSAWQDAATFAIQMLVEYMDVHQKYFNTPLELFVAFSNALYTGTIENRDDPSGLWWRPRQWEDANRLIGSITHFTDWLAKRTDDKNLQLNPWRQATKHEQRLDWAAYCHRKENAFLSHLWQHETRPRLTRAIRGVFLPNDNQAVPKAFPENAFEKLMESGFRRRARDSRGSQNLRNQAIVYLLHFGGLRLSEALSLWSEDVTVEGGEVVVRIYHPEYGLAPDGSNRATYLQIKYGLRPRNTSVKSIDPLHLGWKNPLITDAGRNAFEVFFYPYETGLKFAQLWRDYHLLQRVKPRQGDTHPYAFTTSSGQPYSHRMFRKAHALAVKSIGLESEKLLGTTPHGHRHAYGQRLARDGGDPITIKNAMHHASIESSQIYTQPSAWQTREGLREVEVRLRSKEVPGEE
jgi:site-specific recombinase XerD